MSLVCIYQRLTYTESGGKPEEPSSRTMVGLSCLSFFNGEISPVSTEGAVSGGESEELASSSLVELSSSSFPNGKASPISTEGSM
jgi:hypothetical protein